jgi:hypothetical protein
MIGGAATPSSPGRSTMHARLLFVAVLTLAAVGCSRTYRIAPVSGRITIDGKPLANATVQFYPMAPATAENPGPTAIGRTDEDGRYTVAPFDGSASKGAVVGKNKVIITLNPPPADPKDMRPRHYVQIPARYNRKSELERDVPPEGGEVNFELSSKP